MLVYKIWIQYTNLFKSYGTETIFQRWKRAITPKIIDRFYSKSNLTYILWLYTCVQNFNPIYQSFQKIRTETIFQSWKFFKVEKGHNSQNNWWILPLTELGLHFMIIYLCIKFQSNTPILSKDIARKPKALRTGRTDVRTVQTAVILYAPPPTPTPAIENGGGIKKGDKRNISVKLFWNQATGQGGDVV